MAKQKPAPQEQSADRLVDIYELIDPRDGSVRYIGKANDAAKRLMSHIRASRSRNTPVYAWFRKLEKLGLVPQIRVISRVTEAEWMHEEKRIIFEARLTHPKILNVADGGNTPKCSLETRKANGRNMQIHPRTIAQRRINGANLGNSPYRVIHNLLRFLGQNALYFKKRGDVDRCESAKELQDFIRGFDHEKKIRFSAEFAARHPSFA